MSGRYLLSNALLFVAVSVATGAPVNFIETWEDDTANHYPASPWYVDPCMPDGGLMIISGEIYNNTYGGSNGLLVNYAGFNGKDAGIQARLVPDGQEVQATDASKLTVKYNAKGDLAQQSEWYLEISLGDVHVPRLADVGIYNPLPAPIPVLAYCKPFEDPSVRHRATYFFDGRMWWPHGFIDYDDSWAELTAIVGTNTLYVQCLCNNNPYTAPRQYLGNFDRVSIYTRDGIYPYYTVIDHLRITGGNILNTLTVSPSDLFVSIGPVGGAFAPECKTYTLTNITPSPIDWSATKVQNWLTVSPDSGTLDGGASIDVNVCVNANANALPQALYTDVVTFTDITNSSIQTRNVELYVGQIDSFTEELNGNNDLSNRSVMLTPDASPHLYNACGVTANQFPTPPSGGTNLAFSGDNSVKVTLAQGAQVSLYGTAYPEFYVGTNGYITFGQGDTSATGLVLDHFNKPRISGLFADLAPQTGQVSYKQLMDRVAVTYQNVVKAGTSEANTFQIEMFYDGRIRLTWLGVATNHGVVGLSKGLGVPTNYHSSDFSAYAACPPAGFKGDFDDDGDIDQADFGSMQVCFPLLPGLIVDSVCVDADMDLDGVVGPADVLAFSNCFSGPNVTPPTSCIEFGAGQ